ncbi:MAG: phosphoribosylformylglycinamidine synthase subunit PurQ, partial [Nitrospirota bacterium]|nr:phosphoribosylformylglycinamidine synthase subunit PurQ [Nitrospirota bacterium]
AGHDRSDGGLITTLLEMAFAGDCGLDINISAEEKELTNMHADALSLLFSEELGFAIEYLPENEKEIAGIFLNENIPYQIIGSTLTDKRILINLNKQSVLNEDMRVLRDVWEETGYQLERLQASPECAEEERKNNFDKKAPAYVLGFEPEDTPSVLLESKIKPKVAIIREEGSNSDREMTSAFYQAGFEPWDITITDFLEDRADLTDFKGVAFVGGFSYADVLDSAKGWAGVMKFNKKIWEGFQAFYNRKDTFSLGVCNGCQLMALLGWVPWQGLDYKMQPRFIHNSSGRFESRFSSVKILPGPSIMLSGMEGSVLGVWVAHGEGKAYFPQEDILEKVEAGNLAPIRYVDDNNEITMRYPFNPNGSARGIAGMCSPDGRHLALMPHPERTFLKWQWPWMPEGWSQELKASPWLKMFQNAREWCG